MNTFTVLCVYDMTLVLLKSNGKMLMKWLSKQFLRCCSCMSSFRETADVEVTTSATRFSLCVVNKSKPYREQTLRMLSNRSHGCQTLINLCHIAYSRTHLVLQAIASLRLMRLTTLGKTTSRFSILDGIEEIRSVPKNFLTRYPALAMSHIIALGSHLFLFPRDAGGKAFTSQAVAAARFYLSLRRLLLSAV